MSIGLFALFLSLSSSFAWNDMPLSPPFPRLRHPIPSSAISRNTLPPRSDLSKIFPTLTAVKSQGSRGTCSIFSTTALLESLLVLTKQSDTSVDLSEQFLAFLAAHENQSEGSNAGTNWQLISRLGTVPERLLSYQSSSWKEDLEDPSSPAYQECGRAPVRYQNACLWAQGAYNRLSSREWAPIKVESVRFRDQPFRAIPRQGWMMSVDDVKRSLAAGVPVVLELEFYYGAWNHRLATQIGITPDPDAVLRGEVGYPEIGSIDRQRSGEHPSGHSVLVVGYDDQAEMKTRQLMDDGTVREFTYRGVYFFKNSWGTERFGVQSQLFGPTPGYGVITQKYANDFGEFFGTIGR